MVHSDALFWFQLWNNQSRTNNENLSMKIRAVNTYKNFNCTRCNNGTFAVCRYHWCPSLDQTLISSFTLHCSAFIIAWACLSSAETHRGEELSQRKNFKTEEMIKRTEKDQELTCEQDSELVSRDRNNSVFGAWLCSLWLQLQLNQWFIHLPEFTGAQSVINTPANRVQTSHCKTLQSRIYGALQSALSQQYHRRHLWSSDTFVFLFEKHSHLRLISLSLSCSAECLSSYDLQRLVVCSKRMDVF